MIKIVNENNMNELVELALMLFESSSADELRGEFLEIMNSENGVLFIKYADEKAVGFAQCQLRFDYVEGTETSPVGYLEGIFVKEEYRHSGYAKALLAECEKWSKLKGCTEFASDCELNNRASLAFHPANGFDEANRIICFTKKL